MDHQYQQHHDIEVLPNGNILLISYDRKTQEEVLDLGNQPPANSLHKNNLDMPPLVPLRLLFCNDCSAVQLGETVDPEYLFNEFVWVTGTSSTAEIYSKEFTKTALTVSGLSKPSGLEIASNDGSFLKCFQHEGCEVLGVDPAKNIADKAIKNNSIDR